MKGTFALLLIFSFLVLNLSRRAVNFLLHNVAALGYLVCRISLVPFPHFGVKRLLLYRSVTRAYNLTRCIRDCITTTKC